MKGVMTYNHSGNKVLPAEHLENVRNAARKNRIWNGEYSSEIKSDRSMRIEDKYKIDNVLNEYLTSITYRVLGWRNAPPEVSLQWALNTLESRIHKEIDNIEFVLFLSQYIKTVCLLNAQFPYPLKADLLSFANYAPRVNAFQDYKKESVTKLKEILNVENSSN